VTKLKGLYQFELASKIIEEKISDQ